MNQGILLGPTAWICPKCGKVYSPTTLQCWSCNNPAGQEMAKCPPIFPPPEFDPGPPNLTTSAPFKK